MWNNAMNEPINEKLSGPFIINMMRGNQHFNEVEVKVKERTLELTKALEHEIDISKMKSDFVSMASHEFRTPLSTILSSVFLIEQYVKNGEAEKGEKHFERIKSSVDNLSNILNDFLSLDQLQQGKMQLKAETFDLHRFAGEIVTELTGMLKQGQRIQISYKGENEIVQDKNILRNTLLNLLSNAIKYSGENMVINLLIEVSNNVVSVIVKDEGIGIPVEEQKSLFLKFFRAKNTTGILGTGLGLNIVKRYVELLQVTISCVSAVNKGSAFSIEFPQKTIE